MRAFAYHRLSTSYKDLFSRVVRDGDIVDSRVGRTREVLGFHLELRDPCECIVRRDGFNKRLMEVECAMILAGVFDEELVRTTTPRAADLVGASTAYGPRIVHQLDMCANELLDSPESRRAVCYIGRANDLANVRMNDPRVKGEMPCTETVQFLVRDCRLHLCVSMRSWDLVWGLSYDVPMFASLQIAMAQHLGVHIGGYYHFAGSAHVYERHWGLKIEDNSSFGRLDVSYLGDTIEDTRWAAAEWIRKQKRKARKRVGA